MRSHDPHIDNEEVHVGVLTHKLFLLSVSSYILLYVSIKKGLQTHSIMFNNDNVLIPLGSSSCQRLT